MSNIDKRALREAAEKATPGRWEYYPGNTSIEYNVDSMDEDQGSILYVDSGDFTQKQTDLNGAFIAAANPATVLALLDELEAKDKRMNEILAPNMLLPAIDDMDEDNLRHVIKTVCENYSLLHAKWEAAENRAEAAEKRIAELARIALPSLEAEPVCVIDQPNLDYLRSGADADVWPASRTEMGDVLLYHTTPPAPVSVPESEPVAYIFKHPAGRLFWSLTDESNKGQSDVMPVYSAPVPAFVPPAIEPDYEVIKGILPTANPDEYACCIAADMWNACRAAMLQGAEPVTTANKLRDAVETIRNSGIAIDAEKILAERDALNAPDCWCRTCRPITLADMRFVVCPVCGNKRCPHANDHRNACTASNEPGQEGSAYPAAPQQEVKP